MNCFSELSMAAYQATTPTISGVLSGFRTVAFVTTALLARRDPASICFRRYHVAPRLGTATVRRRLLASLLRHSLSAPLSKAA